MKPWRPVYMHTKLISREENRLTFLLEQSHSTMECDKKKIYIFFRPIQWNCLMIAALLTSSHGIQRLKKKHLLCTLHQGLDLWVQSTPFLLTGPLKGSAERHPKTFHKLKYVSVVGTRIQPHWLANTRKPPRPGRPLAELAWKLTGGGWGGGGSYHGSFFRNCEKEQMNSFLS